MSVFCATEQPKRPTDAELAAASDALIFEWDAHNTRGVIECGWTP